MGRKPDFETARLRVWLINTNHTPLHRSRRLYVAMVKDQDWPGIAVSLSVWPEFENTVDWVQTADPMRGNGYAEELICAIGDLSVSGVSESGIALENRLLLSKLTTTKGPQ